jgi:hypothetical protein
MGLVEKVVIVVVDKALGAPRITKGTYASLDSLALRGQSGYLSTFTTSSDMISQLVGICYYTPENLAKELGPMKLAVLKDRSSYDGFGEISSITGFGVPQIFDIVQQKLAQFSVVVVELGSITSADELAARLLPHIDSSNVALCAILGYADGATIPQFPVAPVVDPSWKVIGPDVVPTLSVSRPLLFVSASQKLTRIDKVQAFDEGLFEELSSMGVLPICQLFREYSYYTGSSWKYGA